ncbi:toxin-antitoxin system YwqK family antitoxin [Winogradskyella sp. A2]|uniref:toxin-antitoxin system YwqK family antitoxin n=1 Tax=Winogradskyella sp. A2 TaxID=3366944 RepID=UPI00398C4139
MKYRLLIMVLVYHAFLIGQNQNAMSDVELKREVSMADVDGKRTDGIYRYYAKGETKPYTGILFSKHENGQIASWQEFENGIGQGQWINYYPNGNFKEVGNYNENRVEGPIKKFYEDGTLKASGNYKDWRIRISVWNYYNQKGQLKTTEDYGEKGNISEVTEYYERGEISYTWYSNILKKNGFKL